MTTIYLDLDGTILDVRQRLCSIYFDVVRELGGRTLSAETYWRSKRKHLAEETVAIRSGIEDTQQYVRLRKAKLEDALYLNHDRLVPSALESLAYLKNNNRLILVTMRRNRENLYHQLRKLSIEPLLDSILSRGDRSNVTKADIIRGDFCTRGNSYSILVGDTELDLVAGRLLGMSTVAVLSGIRNKSILALYHPDRIIENIGQLAGCRINGHEF